MYALMSVDIVWFSFEIKSDHFIVTSQQIKVFGAKILQK